MHYRLQTQVGLLFQRPPIWWLTGWHNFLALLLASKCCFSNLQAEQKVVLFYTTIRFKL